MKASALMYTIDNDDAQGGWNTREGFNTYMQYSYLMYGDARSDPTGGSTFTYYKWHYPTFSSNTKMAASLSVYLNHNDFTDPGAVYNVQCGPSGNLVMTLQTVNQNLAPSGWSYLTTGRTSGANISGYVRVYSSSPPGYTTGADGIRLTIYSYT